MRILAIVFIVSATLSCRTSPANNSAELLAGASGLIRCVDSKNNVVRESFKDDRNTVHLAEITHSTAYDAAAAVTDNMRDMWTRCWNSGENNKPNDRTLCYAGDKSKVLRAAEKLNNLLFSGDPAFKHIQFKGARLSMSSGGDEKLIDACTK